MQVFRWNCFHGRFLPNLPGGERTLHGRDAQRLLLVVGAADGNARLNGETPLSRSVKLYRNTPILVSASPGWSAEKCLHVKAEEWSSPVEKKCFTQNTSSASFFGGGEHKWSNYVINYELCFSFLFLIRSVCCTCGPWKSFTPKHCFYFVGIMNVDI